MHEWTCQRFPDKNDEFEMYGVGAFYWTVYHGFDALYILVPVERDGGYVARPTVIPVHTHSDKNRLRL